MLQCARRADTDYVTLPIPTQYAAPGLPDDVDAGSYAIADQFVRAVLDDEPMSPTFADGLRAQELMDAILRSDATGQRQDMPG